MRIITAFHQEASLSIENDVGKEICGPFVLGLMGRIWCIVLSDLLFLSHLKIVDFGMVAIFWFKDVKARSLKNREVNRGEKLLRGEGERELMGELSEKKGELEGKAEEGRRRSHWAFNVMMH
ncbi:uncharacterized protein G2W53_004469 [Senna tora]|uniref:Uncharacterized protein n=1 Tax=Senna tora TaxID=362788 RepID=A0A835CGH7_9FABA|nr:uncharacterized protein G2W53_004469 [Senna tora]